ncbi:unnamed protein product [Alopecurus aequalis]
MYGGSDHYDGNGGGHYDGNGGGGGAENANNIFGGRRFMPSQSTNTPEGSSGITKTRGAQTLLPLTVKQIMDASQDNNQFGFVVNGTETEISTVRLVGRMLNKNERVTNVLFDLDDGTGRMEVKRWLVTNYNDITHHFLHCIYVHLDLTRSKRSSSQPTVNVNTSTSNQVPAPNNLAPTNVAGTELSDLVMSVFHDPVLGNLEHGVSVDQVASRLKLADGLARSTILHLVDLGNLYPTIDDNHYKSALNG